MCNALAKLGKNGGSTSLSQYCFHSFYTMRTDTLDRFGTRLEKRFTLPQIKQMMQEVGVFGLEDIVQDRGAVLVRLWHKKD